jgi:DNA-binding NarL/FixJ family response regulator
VSSLQHLLLIDGYDQDRAYYAQRLKDSLPDFVVVEAPTGRDGLAVCSFRKIDCVILEIDLPDMSGFEALVRLVPIVHHPEIAVIVLTRLTNQNLLDLAIKNGAQAALQKTVTSGDVLDQVVLKVVAKVNSEKEK